LAVFGQAALSPFHKMAVHRSSGESTLAKVRIGNGCGFWGDNLDAPIALAERGRLDYLTLEYLAELTMSILALQKQQNPERGFASDFLDVLDRLAPSLKSQPGLKVITNAGGMNPAACARQSRMVLDRHGLNDRRIGVVSGDDLWPDLDRLLASGEPFTNLDDGGSLQSLLSRVVSANAYLGARPIITALHQGASIVITGRIADASLTVAPAVHELHWGWDDWNRLSSATVAGHLIECGAQATGGLWCNWQDAPDFANVGYPIVEIGADGSFLLSKTPESGGAVNCETITEQLLYEVGDPRAYLTPDVVADFTSVQMQQDGPETVSIRGARGLPATDSYKVSIAYRDGFTASGMLAISGPDARIKAKRCGEMIFSRLERAGAIPEYKNVELLGTNDVVPGVLPVTYEPVEVVLRVSVRDNRRAVVERFTKEIAPLVTSGPPGVTGYATGRPTVREVFGYWPALVSKNMVNARVELM
jgi:hypothetical protein